MRQNLCALAAVLGLFLATKTAIAGGEMYGPPPSSACGVDAVTNSTALAKDWFMCVMNMQPPNILPTDWTVDVQFDGWSLAPKNVHFYVEGNPLLPIYHLALGKWSPPTGH